MSERPKRRDEESYSGIKIRQTEQAGFKYTYEAQVKPIRQLTQLDRGSKTHTNGRGTSFKESAKRHADRYNTTGLNSGFKNKSK